MTPPETAKRGRAPTRRGRPFHHRPNLALTDDVIIDAALQIVRSEGMARLTVQAVAERLDVSRAPIYARFSSREALWETVIDHILAQQLPRSVPNGVSWPDKLRLYAFSAFETYEAYPGVATELLRTGFPDTEMGRKSARYLVDLLKEAGFHTSLAQSLILSITGLIIGAVMEIQGQNEREKELSKASKEEKQAYQRRRGDTLPSRLLGKEDFAYALNVLIRGIENTPREPT